MLIVTGKGEQIKRSDNRRCIVTTNVRILVLIFSKPSVCTYVYTAEGVRIMYPIAKSVRILYPISEGVRILYPMAITC